MGLLYDIRSFDHKIIYPMTDDFFFFFSSFFWGGGWTSFDDKKFQNYSSVHEQTASPVGWISFKIQMKTVAMLFLQILLMLQRIKMTNMNAIPYPMPGR